jgi:hypothetical protein
MQQCSMIMLTWASGLTRNVHSWVCTILDGFRGVKASHKTPTYLRIYACPWRQFYHDHWPEKEHKLQFIRKCHLQGAAGWTCFLHQARCDVQYSIKTISILSKYWYSAIPLPCHVATRPHKQTHLYNTWHPFRALCLLPTDHCMYHRGRALIVLCQLAII